MASAFRRRHLPTSKKCRRAVVQVKQAEAPVDLGRLVQLKEPQPLEDAGRPAADGQQPAAAGQQLGASERQKESPRIPSAEVIGSLFDLVAGYGVSSIGLGEMRQAIALLRIDYELDLKDDDIPRFMALLRLTNATGSEEGNGRVSRSQFVAGVRIFSSTLATLSARGFGLDQLRSVLVAVFERLDANDDGKISLSEFLKGLAILDIDMDHEQAACLHSFFAPEEDLRAESISKELSLQEKVESILKGGTSLLQERFHLDSFAHLAKALRDTAITCPGTPQAKLKAILDTAWEEVEDVCNVAESAVEVVSLAFGTQYLLQAAENGLAEGMDLEEVAPFAILLAALGVKISKDLSELAPRGMSANEALLYWGVFKDQGFSQASFLRLLACKGCRWGEAKPGEVLSDMEGSSLRIIVKGTVAVKGDAANTTGDMVSQNLVIGETTFLGGARMWDRKALVAQGPVTYVHWDFDGLHECLELDPEASSCLTGLLSKSMVNNFRLAASHRAAWEEEEIQSLDVTKAPELLHESFDVIFSKIDIDNDGRICLEELRHSLESCLSIFDKLGFHASNIEFDRLFAYLDTNGDGQINREEFATRLQAVEDWSSALGKSKVTLGDLSNVIARAHSQIDDNGDGLISRDEFRQASHSLDLKLTPSQCDALHSYLDRDGDGLIDLEEWQASAQELHVVSALKDAFSSHAEKKGLKRFAYFSRQMQLALEGPEDPAAKLRSVLRIAWDGIESLGDVASWGLDVFGYGVAALGMWKELCGAQADVDDLDMAPFVLFLVVTGVEMLKKQVESSVTDLSADEALLYTKAFEDAGISLMDFKKLMKFVKPWWKDYHEGEVVMQPDESYDALRIIVKGGCNRFGAEAGLCTWSGSGAYLGGCEPDGSGKCKDGILTMAVATEPTKIVAWPMEKLRPHLERNPEVRMKLMRAMTTSMAQSLLEINSA